MGIPHGDQTQVLGIFTGHTQESLKGLGYEGTMGEYHEIRVWTSLMNPTVQSLQASFAYLGLGFSTVKQLSPGAPGPGFIVLGPTLTNLFGAGPLPLAEVALAQPGIKVNRLAQGVGKGMSGGGSPTQVRGDHQQVTVLRCAIHVLSPELLGSPLHLPAANTVEGNIDLALHPVLRII